MTVKRTYGDLYGELTKSRVQQLVDDVKCLLDMIERAQDKNIFKELPLSTLKKAAEKVMNIAKGLGYSASCRLNRAVTDLPYVLCGFIPRIRPHGDITYVLYTLRNTPLKIAQSIYPSFNPDDSFIKSLGLEKYQPFGSPPIKEVEDWTTFISFRDYPRYFYLKEEPGRYMSEFRAYITNSLPDVPITCDRSVGVRIDVNFDSIINNTTMLGTAILLLSITSARALMSIGLRECPISSVLTHGIAMNYDSYYRLYESSNGILSKRCGESSYRFLLEDLALHAEQIVKGDVDIFFSRGSTGTVYLITAIL
ncbi:hypothetical protein [Thermoproteus tenax]|uniref:Uncharacterized protein n=1 Tax=Thermoproteus tenax (strain ATCC 35583 / DSM 2078 / JCM 9277 / NBRC 100435 / Kra 1) TaxID=768679 RepID=G4RMX9_THETK|nr:hypothetical protein [Thermoproteus tenax]CCC80923.1 hypothetical protein TTX_0247 [Thermoproteus tenax Kra 1]